MKEALSHLLNDFLSAILFLVVYLLSGNVVAAAAIAVAAGLAQLAIAKLVGRPIEPMQWMSLGLVVVLGGLTMLTHSPRFMMVKPSVAHFAIAALMLRRGWMIRYLPDIVRHNLPDGVMVAAGYAWAALLAGLGLANLGFAWWGDMAAWAWFISVGATGAKIAAFLLQVAVFRLIISRRRARSVALPSPPATAI